MWEELCVMRSLPVAEEWNGLRRRLSWGVLGRLSWDVLGRLSWGGLTHIRVGSGVLNFRSRLTIKEQSY